MSEENVEMVRRIYEAHNRGGVDASEPYWASDIEAVEAPEFPDATRRVGAAQVREMLSNYMSVGWDGLFHVQEYIDAGSEVIVVWQMHAIAPGSGVSLAAAGQPTTFFHVCELEEGKLKRLRQFLSQEQALEAAGLSEWAMSQQNVEVVRRVNELFSRGAWDEWVEHWDPEVVVMPPKGWPEGEDPQGIEAWRRQAERLRDSWEEARAEVDEVRPVGDDQVLARIRYVTRGRDAAMSFDTPMGAVFRLRDGRIVRAQYFWEYDDALEAVGLSE